MANIQLKVFPLPVLLVLAVAIVIGCAVNSALIAFQVFGGVVAGLAWAVGIVLGVYLVVVSRSGFTRFVQRRGVWPSLLIAYGLRLILAATSPMADYLKLPWLRVPDLYIGAVSMRLCNEMFGSQPNLSKDRIVFFVTLVDALLQHVLLAIVFGMVLLILRPYCAEGPQDNRGFDILQPGRV